MDLVGNYKGQLAKELLTVLHMNHNVQNVLMVINFKIIYVEMSLPDVQR